MLVHQGENTWPTHPHKAHPTCMHLPTLPPLLAKNAHVLNVDVESKSGFGSVITTGKDMLKILDESWTYLLEGAIERRWSDFSRWLIELVERDDSKCNKGKLQSKEIHTHKAHNDNARSCITGIWYLHHWKKVQQNTHAHNLPSYHITKSILWFMSIPSICK